MGNSKKRQREGREMLTGLLTPSSSSVLVKALRQSSRLTGGESVVVVVVAEGVEDAVE